jgi:hypothetical protein
VTISDLQGMQGCIKTAIDYKKEQHSNTATDTLLAITIATAIPMFDDIKVKKNPTLNGIFIIDGITIEMYF